MIISVEVDPPTRSDRRISWIVGVVIATIFAALVLLSLAQAEPLPGPTPTPAFHRAPVALTADQETYLVYATWLRSAAFADCMKARGFSREAVAGSEHSRVQRVAAFLGVQPQRPTSWLAPAEARNGQPASAHAQAADLNLALKGTQDGGCQGQRERVDVGNASAVSAALDSARADHGFTQYLAESAWLAENPADALLYQSHLLLAAADPNAPQFSGRWLQELDSMMAAIDAAEGWSEGPSEGYADFAQAVAIGADGSMVVVRVGDPAVIVSGFVSNIQRPMIDCGEVGVVVGAGAFSAPATDPTRAYNALASAVCGAAKLG